MNFDQNTWLILAGVFAAVVLPRLGALGPIVAQLLSIFKIKPVEPTPNPANPLDLTSLAAQIAKLIADLLLPQVKLEVQKQFQAMATQTSVEGYTSAGVSVVQSSEGTTVTAPGFDVKVTK